MASVVRSRLQAAVFCEQCCQNYLSCWKDWKLSPTFLKSYIWHLAKGRLHSMSFCFSINVFIILSLHAHVQNLPFVSHPGTLFLCLISMKNTAMHSGSHRDDLPPKFVVAWTSFDNLGLYKFADQFALMLNKHLRWCKIFQNADQ